MNSVRVKFCGMTRIEDVLVAAELGVHALGLVLVAESPRALDVQRAKSIASCVPSGVQRVALFRNPSVREVQDALDQIPLELLQFHGDESPQFCAQFGYPWMKAVPMGALLSSEDVAAFLQEFAAADGFLFDSHGGARSGGSGHGFDWHRLPAHVSKPVWLAGGLRAETVFSAIHQVKPWAVDVSSGIESAPGIKDHAKMAAFMNEVHRAGSD